MADVDTDLWRGAARIVAIRHDADIMAVEVKALRDKAEEIREALIDLRTGGHVTRKPEHVDAAIESVKKFGPPIPAEEQKRERSTTG